MKENVHPLTQVGYGDIFAKILAKVNADYNFNITGNNWLRHCSGKDLAYDSDYPDRIILFYCGGYGTYVRHEAETTFQQDFEEGGLNLAEENLEKSIRTVLDAIVLKFE